MRMFLLAAFAALFLAACGGGGSSSSSGSSGGVSGANNPITTSKLTARLSSIQYNDAAPDSFTVRWTDTDVANILVGFPPDVPEVDWLGVELFGNASPLTIQVSAIPNNLAVGSYSTTLRVVAADASDVVLGTRDVTVNYTVTERPMLTIDDTRTLTFHGIIGGGLAAFQDVRVIGAGVDWVANGADNFVYVDTSSGVANSDVSISVSSQDLNPGRYESQAIFTDAKLQDRSVAVDVIANFQDALRLENGSLEQLEFSVAEGGANPEAELVGLTGNGVSFSANTTEDWVVFDAATGSTADGLSVGIDPSGLAQGVYTAVVTITDSDENYDQSTSFNVELTVEPRLLMVATTGVALTSTPDLEKLTQTVQINENGGQSLPWAAVSDQSWLTVSSSGQTGDTLTVLADPTGLAVDTVHFAQVTVDSSNAFISNTEVINVGFWVGVETGAEKDVVTESYDHLITDPVRPYVYMHKSGTTVDVYNVHTTSLVTSFDATVARGGDMAISDDGENLFIIDLTNRALKQLDLSNYSEVNSWNMDNGFNYDLIEFARVKNQNLIFNNNNMVVHVASGDNLDFTTEPFFGYDGQLDASRNGEVLCSINQGISPFSLTCHELDYSFATGGEVKITEIGTVSGGEIPGVGSNGRDVAVSAEGDRVYTASGAPYVFVGWDVQTMQVNRELPGDAFPNNVEIGSDDLLYGGIDSPYGEEQIWVYNERGVEMGTYKAESILARQLGISGDSLRMIALIDPFNTTERTEFITVK